MTGALTALDVMVLLSVGVSAAFGGLRGFVSEIFSLVAWIAGFIAVKVIQEPVAGFLVGPVGTWGGANVLSVALVFGAAFLVVRMAGNALGSKMRGSLLAPVDRALGVGFGALKGLLAATLAFLLMTLVYDTINSARAPRPDWMVKSRTYELLRASSAALVDAVEAGRAR